MLFVFLIEHSCHRSPPDTSALDHLKCKRVKRLSKLRKNLERILLVQSEIGWLLNEYSWGLLSFDCFVGETGDMFFFFKYKL